MTHTGPMQESEGTFDEHEGLATRECKQCKKYTGHRCQTWDSSCGGYTDYKYTCLICATVHWVDGPDS